ncbi:hypothetical protein ACFXTH_009100 [Malus domestica]
MADCMCKVSSSFGMHGTPSFSSFGGCTRWWEGTAVVDGWLWKRVEGLKGLGRHGKDLELGRMGLVVAARV